MYSNYPIGQYPQVGFGNQVWNQLWNQAWPVGTWGQPWQLTANVPATNGACAAWHGIGGTPNAGLWNATPWQNNAAGYGAAPFGYTPYGAIVPTIGNGNGPVGVGQQWVTGFAQPPVFGGLSATWGQTPWTQFGGQFGGQFPVGNTFPAGAATATGSFNPFGINGSIGITNGGASIWNGTPATSSFGAITPPSYTPPNYNGTNYNGTNFNATSYSPANFNPTNYNGASFNPSSSGPAISVAPINNWPIIGGQPIGYGQGFTAQGVNGLGYNGLGSSALGLFGTALFNPNMTGQFGVPTFGGCFNALAQSWTNALPLIPGAPIGMFGVSGQGVSQPWNQVVPQTFNPAYSATLTPQQFAQTLAQQISGQGTGGFPGPFGTSIPSPVSGNGMNAAGIGSAYPTTPLENSEPTPKRQLNRQSV